MRSILLFFFKLIFLFPPLISFLTFLTFLTFLPSSFCLAQESASEFIKDKTKKLTIEWEEVVGSHSYEVEVFQILDASDVKKVGLFQMQNTAWDADLSPGKYQFRIRSLDIRGVPGTWGAFTVFTVSPPPPDLLSPKNDDKIQTEQEDKFAVNFSWTPVKGASSYKLEIFQDEESSPLRFDVTNTKYSQSLPVAKSYRWQVSSMDADKKLGDPVKNQFSFSLFGKKLENPEIEIPESEFATRIQWKKPKKTELFSYSLSRKRSNGSWELLEKNLNYKSNFLEINPKHPGGTFQLKLKANAKLRPSSDIQTMEFPVYAGERTPKAIETAKLRKALERDKENYFIATYLVSSLNYAGDNKETGNRVAYSVLGGTGRLGYGYMPKTKWGFLTILDHGGVNLKQKIYTYSSIEAYGVWRRYLSQATQLRIFSGLFIKETPEATTLDLTEVSVKKVQHLGPVLGLQFWTSFNYKYGFQFNFQLNESLLKLSTPNGKDLVPSATYQIGAMGSYKLKENLTGFAGLAYRVDRVVYKSKAYSGDSEINFANEGDINSVLMTGTYLNLYAEWGF